MSDPHVNGRTHRQELAARAHWLIELYIIACGLALASGLETIVVERDGITTLRWVSVPLCLAFLVTLVPFFHGAMLALDSGWVKGSDTLTASAVITDFLALFAQMCLLFLLGRFELDPRGFLLVLMLLLTVDVVWILIGQQSRWRRNRALRSRGRCWGREVLGYDAERTVWMWINSITVVALAAIYVSLGHLGGLTVSLLVLGVCLARTGADYWLARDLYFGNLRG